MRQHKRGGGDGGEGREGEGSRERASAGGSPGAVQRGVKEAVQGAVQGEVQLRLGGCAWGSVKSPGCKS